MSGMAKTGESIKAVVESLIAEEMK